MNTKSKKENEGGLLQAATSRLKALNLLITGRPGVGKTTLVECLIEELRGALRLAGFTTTEVRNTHGERLGFDIVTVGGKRAELARVGFHSRIRVGRYGVNLAAFEQLALLELACKDVDLIVVRRDRQNGMLLGPLPLK